MNPDNYLAFETTPDWWKSIPLVRPRAIGAPDGRLISLTDTALCIRKEPCCYICGEPVNKLVLHRKKTDEMWTIQHIKSLNSRQMTKDHILPRLHGGKNCLDNYRTSCSWCNQYKGCAHEEPIFCWGFLKHAQSSNETDKWLFSNSYANIGLKISERLNKTEAMVPWMGFVQKRGQINPALTGFPTGA